MSNKFLEYKKVQELFEIVRNILIGKDLGSTTDQKKILEERNKEIKKYIYKCEQLKIQPNPQKYTEPESKIINFIESGEMVINGRFKHFEECEELLENLVLDFDYTMKKKMESGNYKEEDVETFLKLNRIYSGLLDDIIESYKISENLLFQLKDCYFKLYPLHKDDDVSLGQEKTDVSLSQKKATPLGQEKTDVALGQEKAVIALTEEELSNFFPASPEKDKKGKKGKKGNKGSDISKKEVGNSVKSLPENFDPKAIAFNTSSALESETNFTPVDVGFLKETVIYDSEILHQYRHCLNANIESLRQVVRDNIQETGNLEEGKDVFMEVYFFDDELFINACYSENNPYVNGPNKKINSKDTQTQQGLFHVSFHKNPQIIDFKLDNFGKIIFNNNEDFKNFFNLKLLEDRSNHKKTYKLTNKTETQEVETSRTKKLKDNIINFIEQKFNICFLNDDERLGGSKRRRTFKKRRTFKRRRTFKKRRTKKSRKNH